MQRPNASGLYGLLMITALFVAVLALVTAMGAPSAGAQANTRGIAAPARESETPRADRTRTAEPHETEHPHETETPHAERTRTPEPHETEHPHETETPRATTTTVPATVPGGAARTFPQTGKAVNGLFLAYWDDRGALAQQG